MKRLFDDILIGKKVKLFYYISNFSSYLFPNVLFRKCRENILSKSVFRADYEYIQDRVAYYHKQSDIVQSISSEQTLAIKDFKRKNHKSTYFFDAYSSLKYFDVKYRFAHIFGDVIQIPALPSLVKSRPIAGENANSVLLNLDKFRHFVFVQDPYSWEQKCDSAIFLGDMRKPHRVKFLEKYFGSEFCHCGHVFSESDFMQSWYTPPMSIREHLKYKFILAIEGNDVATNLKWIMSSNSLAVMPKPTYETWFMEGKLQPNVHYVEIKPDYSDLKEKIDYYRSNPAEAQAIVRNANSYIKQFNDKKRERIISLMVLDKYFKATKQC